MKEIAHDFPFSSRLNNLDKFCCTSHLWHLRFTSGVLSYNGMFSSEFASEYLQLGVCCTITQCSRVLLVQWELLAEDEVNSLRTYSTSTTLSCEQRTKSWNQVHCSRWNLNMCIQCSERPQHSGECLFHSAIIRIRRYSHIAQNCCHEIQLPRKNLGIKVPNQPWLPNPRTGKEVCWVLIKDRSTPRQAPWISPRKKCYQHTTQCQPAMLC